MSQQLIQALIKEEENLYLEYKYKWYWDKGVRAQESQWGEFLKDFVALVNCTEKYVEDNKYLIIGIDENEVSLDSRLIHTELSDSNFPTLQSLKEKIIDKLNTFFRIDIDKSNVFDNFTIDYYTIKYNVSTCQDYLTQHSGLFKNLCQSGKITITQGNTDEDRNRCRAICS